MCVYSSKNVTQRRSNNGVGELKWVQGTDNNIYRDGSLHKLPLELA